MTEAPGEKPFAGILVVDKQKGMTSHDVVALVRKRFFIKKVGHAGTLDPNATGVLVLLLGKATKMSNELSSEEKEYVATMKLGEKTDSADSDGEVIERKEVSVSEEEVTDVILSFTGEIEQVPPMVSAKKVNGQRLYKLARKGIHIERKPVKVTIEDIEIEEIKLPLVTFRVACTKGTYVRQLADDMGEKLGCGAHLTELRRTCSGSFFIKDAYDIDDIRKMGKEEFNEAVIRV